MKVFVKTSKFIPIDVDIKLESLEESKIFCKAIRDIKAQQIIKFKYEILLSDIITELENQGLSDKIRKLNKETKA